MEIRVSEEVGFVVLAPAGRLNIESAEAFRQEYQRHLDAGKTHFVVDLGTTEYIDSSGLGALIGLIKRLNARGGTVRICNVPPLIQNIFELTRLNLVLDLRPSRAEALVAG